MRLIDGDKLYKTIAKPVDMPGDTIDVMVVRLDILAAPEVEAIPIQWLRELQIIYLTEECMMSVGIVNEIMNLWSMEKDMWVKEIWEKEK